MKYFLLTLFMLSAYSVVYSQTTEKPKIGLYKWSEVVLMTDYDLNGKKDRLVDSKPRTVSSKVGQLFRVIHINEAQNECYIQVLDYSRSINTDDKYRIIQELINTFKKDKEDAQVALSSIVQDATLNYLYFYSNFDKYSVKNQDNDAQSTNHNLKDLLSTLFNKSVSAEDVYRRKYVDTPDFYKYNFWGNKNNYDNLSSEKINSRDYGEFQAYFKVSLADVEEFSRRESYIAGSLTAGIINFPFKYRPQKDKVDFSGAFNFGAGIGYTFRHKSYHKTTHSIISGYSISNIVLDSSNTVRNQNKLASTNNFTSLSISLGYLIQHQTVQAGIFIGFDQISKINQDQYGWVYQGQPWISIGFGLAIFSGQNEKKAVTTNTN